MADQQPQQQQPTAPATPARAAGEDALPERDRIVVLGRRQSGKTIYLASLYARLWRSLDGLTAKALTGTAHTQMMRAQHLLQNREWPGATLGTTQVDMEVEYHGRKRLLVTLDFAGELFRKAFLEEQSSWPGVKELVHHIDRAAAVLLLVDPSVAAGMDHEAAMEDDFGMVQAVQRIRNWPDGETVPIVLVLTKMDMHQHLLDQFGGMGGFVRHHFPALVRLMKQIPMFQISAVQTEPSAQGRPIPRRDSSPVNIENPLRYCLREIEKAEQQQELQQQMMDRRMVAAKLAREERARERRQNLILWIAVSAIVLAGAVISGLILYRMG